MLALGSDAQLKKLATAEMKSPSSETAQLTIAHGWWDLGEALEGTAQNNVRPNCCALRCAFQGMCVFLGVYGGCIGT